LGDVCYVVGSHFVSVEASYCTSLMTTVMMMMMYEVLKKLFCFLIREQSFTGHTVTFECQESIIPSVIL